MEDLLWNIEIILLEQIDLLNCIRHIPNPPTPDIQRLKTFGIHIHVRNPRVMNRTSVRKLIALVEPHGSPIKDKINV